MCVANIFSQSTTSEEQKFLILMFILLIFFPSMLNAFSVLHRKSFRNKGSYIFSPVFSFNVCGYSRSFDLPDKF